MTRTVGIRPFDGDGMSAFRHSAGRRPDSEGLARHVVRLELLQAACHAWLGGEAAAGAAACVSTSALPPGTRCLGR